MLASAPRPMDFAWLTMLKAICHSSNIAPAMHRVVTIHSFGGLQLVRVGVAQ